MASPTALDLSLVILRARNLRPADRSNGLSDPFVDIFLSDVAPHTQEKDEARASTTQNVKGHRMYSTATQWETLNPEWNDPFVLKNVPLKNTLTFKVWDRDAYMRNDWLGDAQLQLADFVDNDTSVLCKTAESKNPVPHSNDSSAVSPMQDAFSNQKEITLPVVWQDNKVMGDLTVSIGVLGKTEHANLPTRREGPIHWRRHFSKSAGFFSSGIIKSLVRGDKGYHTYSIDLHRTAEVFGDIRQPWSRKHPPAQIIFQEGPAGDAIRAAVSLQHHFLFQHKLGSEAGLVLTTRGLFDLMEWGRRRNKPRLFTYVIHDGRFRFSETGDSFAKDTLSKHAVLADASPEVVYSGEFFIVPANIKGFQVFENKKVDNEVTVENVEHAILAAAESWEGEISPIRAFSQETASPVVEKPLPPLPFSAAENNATSPSLKDSPGFRATGITNPPMMSISVPQDTPLPLLVLNNASGTYAPDKARLPLLEKIWRENFPGIEVMALDFDDEKLKGLKKSAGL